MQKYLQSIIYGITAFIFILSGFIFKNETLDITNHDAYLVIPFNHILWAIGFIFIFYSFSTWTQEHFTRKPNRILFWTHYLLTVTGILLVAFLVYKQSLPQKYDRDYSVEELFSEQMNQAPYLDYITLISIILICIQCLFFVNILICLVKRK